MSKTDIFKSTGDRLNHILDEIGFKEGRGRIPAFQKYLSNRENSDLENLKYSTVRSWFGVQSPPMKKVSVIIELLANDYELSKKVDIEQIKIWWKMGGSYPFFTVSQPVNEIENDGTEKLHFLITSMVTEATGDNFKEIPSNKLHEVKNKAIQLAKDFADPNINRCPPKYIKGFIVSELLHS